MKILVMDDEPLALQRVERLLKELNYTCVAINSLEAFEAVFSTQSFDIFILDIQMPDINGIDLAKKIRQHNPSAFIIFQTAYENFALKAYEVGAIDYLLKPFGKEDLNRSLVRALSYQKEKQNEIFLSKNGDETYLINPKDIVYIQADLSEIIIRTQDHFSYYDHKISQMETMLDDTLFFRVHRSFLINTSKIKHMKTFTQSKIQFSFEGIDDVVISSKEGAKKFREKYKDLG